MLRVLISGFAALLVISLAAVAGYRLGDREAATPEEAAYAEQQTEADAFQRAEQAAFQDARDEATEEALAVGRRQGSVDGELAGRTAGDEDSSAALAEAEAAAAPPEPALEYTDELPHGRPGYLLPEEDRSLGCVGYDAVTGECVGD